MKRPSGVTVLAILSGLGFSFHHRLIRFLGFGIGPGFDVRGSCGTPSCGASWPGIHRPTQMLSVFSRRPGSSWPSSRL
jgi:hypothetical protein